MHTTFSRTQLFKQDIYLRRCEGPLHSFFITFLYKTNQKLLHVDNVLEAYGKNVCQTQI